MLLIISFCFVWTFHQGDGWLIVHTHTNTHTIPMILIFEQKKLLIIISCNKLSALNYYYYPGHIVHIIIIIIVIQHQSKTLFDQPGFQLQFPPPKENGISIRDWSSFTILNKLLMQLITKHKVIFIKADQGPSQVVSAFSTKK